MTEPPITVTRKECGSAMGSRNSHPNPEVQEMLLDGKRETGGTLTLRRRLSAMAGLHGMGDVSRSKMIMMVLFAMAYTMCDAYEAVTKKLAKQESQFDPISLLILMSCLSTVGGVVVSSFSGHIGELYSAKAPKRFLLYAVPGFIFQLQQYLTFMVLMFLPLDVYNVMCQSRVLLLALLSWATFGKKPTMVDWVLLTVISLGAMSYAMMSSTENKVKRLVKELEDTRAGVAVELTKEEDGDYDYFRGGLITLVVVLLQCVASLWAEYFLKKDKHLPFYVQKIYIEVPGLLAAVLLASPLVSSVAIHFGVKKKGDMNIFNDGFFAGWNPTVLLHFIFFMSISWLSGLMVKVWSSLIKQLCKVNVVGLLYFLSLVHLKCPLKDVWWCPSNIKSATINMVVVDLVVVFSVVAYVLLQNKQASTQNKHSPQEPAGLNEVELMTLPLSET